MVWVGNEYMQVSCEIVARRAGDAGLKSLSCDRELQSASARSRLASGSTRLPKHWDPEASSTSLGAGDITTTRGQFKDQCHVQYTTHQAIQTRRHLRAAAFLEYWPQHLTFVNTWHLLTSHLSPLPNKARHPRTSSLAFGEPAVRKVHNCSYFFLEDTTIRPPTLIACPLIRLQRTDFIAI